MNRLQKKCMIVSGGIHLLLAVMLIFGPGFLAGGPDKNAPPILTFVAIKTTDDQASGGGDNTVKNPPALGTSQEPPAVPNPVVTPPVAPPANPVVTPPVEPVQPKVEKSPTPAPKDPPRNNETPKIDLSSVKPTPRKTREINVDTTVVTSSASDAKAKLDAQKKAAAAAAAAEQKRLAAIANAFKSASTGIRGGVAGSTEIRLPGPGGGGVPYANFRAAVQKAYFDAWNVPPGVPNLTITASVVIARDGSVISARITDRCGNSQVDASVQKAIERVKFAAPLPDSATENQRTVLIDFNTLAKLEG